MNQPQDGAQLDRAALERLYRRGIISLDAAKRGADIINGKTPAFNNAKDRRNSPPTVPQEMKKQQPEVSTTLAAWKRMIHQLRHAKGQQYNLAALLRDCDQNSLSWDGAMLHARFKNQQHYERFMEETNIQETYAQFQEALEAQFGQHALASITGPE